MPSAKTRAEEDELVISRTFDVPRALVWKAWTDPQALAQWWGPKGVAIRVAKLEVRPGGMFHYSMQFQPGHDIWGRFVYREVSPPEKLVYASAFSDPSGGITRTPFPQLGEAWPLEILNTLTLQELAGKTMLTLRGAPINASPEGRKMFTAMLGSMQNGFGGTFEKLDAYLAKAGGQK